MSKNEGTGFRRKLFGGFDNNDVIDYIANSQRGWKNEKEALERRLADAEKRANQNRCALEESSEENARLKEDSAAAVRELEKANSLAEKTLFELAEAREKLAGLETEAAESKKQLIIAEERVRELEALLSVEKERADALDAEIKNQSAKAESLKIFAEGVATMLSGLNGQAK